MKKTYSEINEVALDLYGASSSKKEEWVEEYEAYLHGEGNTVWNDEEFADWTDEDKKECYDIIISLYDEKEETTTKKYVVCENTVEIKSGRPLNIRDHEDFEFLLKKELERTTDSTPLREYEFDSEEDARAKFEELKKSIGYSFGHWALYTLTVDEVYIDVYEDDEYWGELEHVYGEPEYEEAE